MSYNIQFLAFTSESFPRYVRGEGIITETSGTSLEQTPPRPNKVPGPTRNKLHMLGIPDKDYPLVILRHSGAHPLEQLKMSLITILNVSVLRLSIFCTFGFCSSLQKLI
jgi:hypothetical protein